MKDNERVLIESDVIWSNPELSFYFQIRLSMSLFIVPSLTLVIALNDQI